MENFNYKMYSRMRMINLIKNAPILFVETSFNDAYVIRKKDVADFIVMETERKGHNIEMEFYMSEIDKPVITTSGWFLNTINPLLRKEIIDRLILLQTGKKKPKKVKIFDIMSNLDKGLENFSIKKSNKIYGKYIKAQNDSNIRMEGV